MKSFKYRCTASLTRLFKLLALSLPLVLVLAFNPGDAYAVCQGPASTTPSLFEDDDGDLAYTGTCADGVTDSDLDWNDFDPVTWIGTAPDQTGSSEAMGWRFVGVEDAQVSSDDIGFVGGTKQDDECAIVRNAKSLNKGDLKRIYLSDNTINGDIFLNLAWVRIPQNSTTASAHVAFEFNKGETPCPSGSDGLVERSPGDMLIVYDFEGGDAAPTIKLARWTITAGDSCDVASHAPPCWGTATELVSVGAAEAAVNVGGSVQDFLGPDGAEWLGPVEFGEAGINLTAAGVFAPGVCESFGSAFAVSRSSGNSGTAQMKDLVGPTPFELDNCGTIIIEKETIGGDGTFGFSVSGLDLTAVSTSGGSSVTSNSFNLVTSSNYDAITITEVPVGVYTVEEISAGAGFSFKDLVCVDDSDGGSNNVNTSSPSSLQTGGSPVATIRMDLKEQVTCTFRNEQAYLTVNKAVVNACTGNNNDGGVFDLLIDGFVEANDVGNGGTTGSVTVGVGSHTVSETNGDSSAVDEYYVEISGDCDSSGNVSLVGGDSKSCTITNVRLPHIKVTKVVNGPAAAFDLYIDGQLVFDDAGNGDSAEVAVSLTGPHTISEKASDGSDVDPAAWLTAITCSDGTSVQAATSLSGISAGSGELVECTIYNNAVSAAAACVEPNGL
ncbi:prealbumin-like fold domain-containing protein [Marinobacterium sediminicola]|nr:hypothetical protein [Marinobacterium sediminicola]ULG68414.1 hypothetical protein LN244_12000 [Marinobacterium sediminicola]